MLGWYVCPRALGCVPPAHAPVRSVNCVRGVLSHMKRRGSGRIALVSSAAGQVGIFGYTGYSASKFALRGFAEALQMEARPYVVAAACHPRFAAHAVCVMVVVSWRASHNIAVSLAFPPDVNTPMLAEEDKTKPAETKEIAGTVSVQQPGACSPLNVCAASSRRNSRVATMVCADAIAAALISGIRAGRFFINFDLLGNLLGFLSAGFAPTVGIVNNLLGVSYGHCLAATCKWLTCVLWPADRAGARGAYCGPGAAVALRWHLPRPPHQSEEASVDARTNTCWCFWIIGKRRRIAPPGLLRAATAERRNVERGRVRVQRLEL